jgi:hypothetical protein
MDTLSKVERGVLTLREMGKIELESYLYGLSFLKPEMTVHIRIVESEISKR